MYNLEFILQELKSDLKESRYIHTLNVAKKAEELANIYDIDNIKATIAALLHDCAKGNEDLYIKEYLEIYDFLINKDEYKEFNNVFLRHCLIGRIVAEEKYGVVDEDILNSILYHTTGRVEMSILEKIIYLADKTEIGRNYPEVENIRKISLTSLNNAIIVSINNNIKYLIDRNQEISVNSILLRNKLIGGISGR